MLRCQFVTRGKVFFAPDTRFVTVRPILTNLIIFLSFSLQRHGGCGSPLTLLVSAQSTMKLSLKFQGQDENHHHMTAKLPITIFNHPFLSTITASSSATASGSDFCFSLSTNFPSGPSLKVSYFPTATSTATASLPFSLSLKSGLGLMGCPRHSPLVFSASFTLSPSYAPLPSFFLHLKPQFGHFSLNKTVFSDAIPPPEPTKPYFATASLDRNGSSSGWQEMKLEPFGARDNNNHNDRINDTPGTVFVPESEKRNNRNGERRGVSAGVAVMARTVMPVTKGLLLNMRWGVNFPEDLGLKMPYLTVNKIGLERVVEESKQENEYDKKGRDLQMLKEMCLWMKKDLEDAEKENREMKQLLDEIRVRSNGGGNGGRKVSHSQHSSPGSSEFERWRSKKSVRESNEKKEPPSPPPPKQSVASDVESELQKAIQAAAAAAASS
ncbi:hypothetical protein HN51_068293 [Arachis hypogaea]|uniref:uncharacterized protein n=1 Tax=Arachis hypogaea TaxID=3818 RepID=UPI000DECBA69|nr:uncharacterized protein LOC112747989 [Arachis hypogaea]XP_025698469.1 uncharacterized protein LOC112800417 [Arachis hypogaea]